MAPTTPEEWKKFWHPEPPMMVAPSHCACTGGDKDLNMENQRLRQEVQNLNRLLNIERGRKGFK